MLDQLTGLQVTDNAEGVSIIAYNDEPSIVQTTVNLTNIILYHDIPELVVRSANMTNGMSLPTDLEGANITVRVNPAQPKPVITFIGGANETAATAGSGSSTGATVMVADIPVKGNTVMHIISAVLVPPQE
jgi:uncharacterized surface protein with fasciclin (FAS1) repeats